MSVNNLHVPITQILSESIMHECMIRLLKSTSDEESLECFAKLMTTTGRDLDKEEAKVCVCVYVCVYVVCVCVCVYIYMWCVCVDSTTKEAHCAYVC